MANSLELNSARYRLSLLVPVWDTRPHHKPKRPDIKVVCPDMKTRTFYVVRSTQSDAKNGHVVFNRYRVHGSTIVVNGLHLLDPYDNYTNIIPKYDKWEEFIELNKLIEAITNDPDYKFQQQMKEITGQ